MRIMRRAHQYSPYTLQAVRLLGIEIRRARRERRWTTAELAERVGITRPTLHNIEQGEPTVGVGIAFEAAALLGIPLFRDEPSQLAIDADRSRERLTVLPQRIRRPRGPVNDDF
jgi:transcriptional regulator with XRE-family HTH domain